MRLVCTADIHSDFYHFMDPPQGDVCIVAGDITNWGKQSHKQALKEYIESQQFMRFLSERFPAVLFIPGNHDCGFRNREYPSCQGIDGRRISWGNHTFYGVSLTTCYGIPELTTTWDFMTCREDVEKAAFAMPSADVIISHGPVLGLLDKSDGCHLGSKYLREYVLEKNPKLVIHGHVHKSGEALLKNTRIFNVSEHWKIIDL